VNALSEREAEILDALGDRAGPIVDRARNDFLARGLPTRRTEAWKYSDLRAAVRRLDTTVMADWHRIDTTGPEPDSVEASPDSELFSSRWAAAMEPAANVYSVGPGETRDIAIDVDGYVGVGHGTIIVRVAKGGVCRLRERYLSEADTLTNRVLRLEVADGATLERVVIQEKSEGAIILSTAHVKVAPGATFRQITAVEGGTLVRMETHVEHGGLGAEVQIDGLYLIADALHADLTTVVRHGGLNGITSQLSKGVVRDTARGVFQGKIIVERGADGTDARMGHHALILGERAEVDAKPELEIYADDVQCAHGNTVGNLDENALFYMQQRGIPADEARALLTEAFLIEVVDRIEHEGAREVVREWLTARL
jgi:Fe-S cluster assembly protein SufD